MACEKDNLAAYLDGETTGEESRRIAGHVEKCPQCREYLELLRRSYAALDVLDAMTVPDGFAERTAAVAARSAAKPVSAFAGVLSAAAVLLLVFTFWRPWNDAKPVATNDTETGISAEEQAVVDNLDLLEDYELLSELDILDNYEVLVELDQLSGFEELQEMMAI